MSRSVVAIASFALVLSGLAGCGGDDDDPAADKASTTTTDADSSDTGAEDPGGSEVPDQEAVGSQACALLTQEEVAELMGTTPELGADAHPDDDVDECTWNAADQAVGPNVYLALADTAGLEPAAWLEAAKKGQTGFEENHHFGQGVYLSTPSDRMVQGGVIVGDQAATIVAYQPPPSFPDKAKVEAALMIVAGRL